MQTPRTLLYNLLEYRSHCCSNTLDYIYAILSISEDAYFFRIDYSITPLELFQQVAKVYAANLRYLHPLLVVATHFRPPANVKWPSWVPYWAQTGTAITFLWEKDKTQTAATDFYCRDPQYRAGCNWIAELVKKNVGEEAMSTVTDGKLRLRGWLYVNWYSGQTPAGLYVYPAGRGHLCSAAGILPLPEHLSLNSPDTVYLFRPPLSAVAFVLNPVITEQDPGPLPAPENAPLTLSTTFKLRFYELVPPEPPDLATSTYEWKLCFTSAEAARPGKPGEDL
jgi:hypothetical protein